MINRNNYEEYLLMYIDGELSPSDMKAVEAFLGENPDLKEELGLLQQAILQPDENLTFADKGSLYRKAEGITLNNYQEYFLLYIDNELSNTERAAVETFVLQQPQLQDAFTLLKQTVLPAEHIVFADKASLYRKEERKPIVIGLRWASLAAAVTIGIIALVMFNNNANNDEVGPVANGDPNGPVITRPGSTSTTPGKLPVAEKNDQAGTIASDVNNPASNKTITQPLKQQLNNEPAPQETVANNYRPEEQQAIVTPVNEDPVTNNVAQVTVPITQVTTTIAAPDEDKNVAATTPAPDNNDFQYTVYTEEEKDKTVYLGSMQVNPDKVRGFFRKATRFLSSKVKGNDDDNDKGKVRVANMEVNKIK